MIEIGAQCSVPIVDQSSRRAKQLKPVINKLRWQIVFFPGWNFYYDLFLNNKDYFKELKVFIRGSGEDGFIMFTVGSVIQINEMPSKILEIFLRSSAKLPRRVF